MRKHSWKKLMSEARDEVRFVCRECATCKKDIVIGFYNSGQWRTYYLRPGTTNWTRVRPQCEAVLREEHVS